MGFENYGIRPAMEFRRNKEKRILDSTLILSLGGWKKEGGREREKETDRETERELGSGLEKLERKMDFINGLDRNVLYISVF